MSEPNGTLEDIIKVVHKGKKVTTIRCDRKLDIGDHLKLNDDELYQVISVSQATGDETDGFDIGMVRCIDEEGDV